MDFPNPKELVQTVGKAAGTAISEGAELADKVLPGDSELVGKAVKPIVDLLDSEEPDGDDGGCPFTGPVELGRCAGFDLGRPRRRVGLIFGL